MVEPETRIPSSPTLGYRCCHCRFWAPNVGNYTWQVMVLIAPNKTRNGPAPRHAVHVAEALPRNVRMGMIGCMGREIGQEGSRVKSAR